MINPLKVLDIALGLLTVVLLIRLVRTKKDRNKLPLPPGPPPLPVIQNLLDLPEGLEGPHWAKHKDLYGACPISSVSAFGTTIVILNDTQVTFDLLEKRSRIYSSRPAFPFGGQMVGFSGTTTLLPYGAQFRAHRKEMHACIGTRAVMARFVELEEIETRRFLFRLFEQPKDFTKHIRTTAGAIILSISHGYTIEPHGPDPFVDLADAALEAFSKSCRAGTWIVDILPFLQHLPAWLPGMKFKRTARDWRSLTMDFVDRPFAFVKAQIKNGHAIPSFASDLIEKQVSDEKDMKWIATTLYGGGADTVSRFCGEFSVSCFLLYLRILSEKQTVSAVTTFFLAMLLFPDAFKKAKEEVDRVVGHTRLPTLADRERLPYIEALEKEVLRWNNVVPMGIPHVVTEEDTYMDYRIPKGTIVLSNIWQMTHDPCTYKDPFEFKPERFLGEAPEMDSRTLVFGFGRRVCPGKELADVSLFLSIAMTVAVFNISRAKDASGREIVPVYEHSPGIISHPSPFGFTIEPRDENSVALIRAVLEDHPFEKGDAEILRSLSI
ncbi:cytochrome protein [Phellopilus nigrolimitatus]|nr:cytochrome protein [Phellopilus nigrolimitatus]